MSGSQSTELSCQLIVGAAEALIRAHELMLQPDPRNLDMACSTLAMAIESVTNLQAVLTASPCRDLRTAVVDLRKEIELISGLLQNAASYHANLMRCMIGASAEPVQQSLCGGSARRLSLEA